MRRVMAGRGMYHVLSSLIFFVSLVTGAAHATEEPFVITVSLLPIRLVRNDSQSILEGSIQLNVDVLLYHDGSWSIVPRNCALDIISYSWGTNLCSGVSLKEQESGQYSLVVKELKTQSITLHDISAQFHFFGSSCVFSSVGSPDIGESFAASGICTYRFGRQPRMTLEAKIDKILLSKVIRLWQKDGQLTMEGLFSGTIRGSFAGGVPALRVMVSNDTPGSIRVHNEIPFLEKRLSDRYYRLLIENFKDYQYNKGAFLITGMGKDITLEGHFESGQGKRDVEIVFHDVFTHGAKK